MVRRTVAAGIGLLVLILLVLFVRGCLNSRKEQAIKDYGSDASELIRESNAEGKSLFNTLSQSGNQDQVVDVQNQLNGLRVQAGVLVDRARDLDVPDELSTAQRYLVDTLEFRRDSLAHIADELPTALGDDQRRQGTDQVAAEMQGLLTSDVIYSQRFKPLFDGAVKEQDLQDQTSVPKSVFIKDIVWLDPDYVADQVAGVRGGGGEATPGLHGSGLAGVTLGGQTLTPGGSATIQLTSDLAFEVQVANQGEHTETDVQVTIKVGSGDDAVTVDGSVDTIAAGETKSVSIPLNEQPPTGQNVPVRVEVKPVPGEQKTDNNSADYNVIFTR
ncbi:MAG TPA: hypothetical protein VGF25_09320 [Thermoleophilaceae bacterium]|jgi:hypothetical protein